MWHKHLGTPWPAEAATCFAKTSRMLADLAGGHADRSWGQRIREYNKPLVLILDAFAMREHTTMHADDPYELISDRAVSGKPLILASNWAPSNWYGPRRRRIATRPDHQHQPPDPH